MFNTQRLLQKLTRSLRQDITVPGRGYEYRGSNLPFCPRAFAISQYLQEQGDEPEGAMQHKLFTIFGMGHGVHLATQNHLGMVGLLFGHWRCVAPASPKHRKSLARLLLAHRKDPILLPLVESALEKPVCNALVRRDYMPGTKRSSVSACPSCGNSNLAHWSYVEYTLADPATGLSAHTDGYIPSAKAVLEIKSTSTRNLRRLPAPYWEHWAYQASFYAGLLVEKEKLPVKRIIMLYVGREGVELKGFVRPVMRNVVRQTRRAYREAQRALTDRRLPTGICTNYNLGRREMECSYASRCFSPTLAHQLGLPKQL